MSPRTGLSELQQPEIVDSAMAAVFAVRRSANGDSTFTLAALAENALRRELERLRKAHNKGRPFLKSEEKLRGGRTLGSRT